MTMDSRSFMLQMYAAHSIKRAQDWSSMIGLEYWAKFGTEGIGASGDAHELGDYGWVITGTLAQVAGSGADFGSSADKGTTPGLSIDTAADAIDSPAIFGDYDHMAQVAALVDAEDLPTLMVFDIWGRFAANNAESASGIGLVEDGGTAAVANDHIAAFVCDGTNFNLRSDSETLDTGIANDLLLHRFRGKLDFATGLVTAYIDDMHTELGTIAIKADEFPCKIGAGVLTSTGANDPVISAMRVRYGWSHLGI